MSRELENEREREREWKTRERKLNRKKERDLVGEKTHARERSLHVGL